MVGLVRRKSTGGRGSGSCSGLNKHVNIGVYLFLTGVPEVTEPSDTSSANVSPCRPLACKKQAKAGVNVLGLRISTCVLRGAIEAETVISLPQSQTHSECD